MKILFVGESWSISQTHIKGFDHATLCRYSESGSPFIEMLKNNDIEVDYLPSHIAQIEFPDTAERLIQYSAIIFSDVGSNTLLLHPDTQFNCIRMPNRLKIIRDYVYNGGGFLMCGGYMSYSGFEGKARYGMTPIADILPVEILKYDDRMEKPEGVVPKIINPSHPILAGIEGNWPDFLGYNKLSIKHGAQLIAIMDDNDAFISATDFGKGRTVAFASDCVPHWGPPEFVGWKHYSTLFVNIIKWLSKKI